MPEAIVTGGARNNAVHGGSRKKLIEAVLDVLPPAALFAAMEGGMALKLPGLWFAAAAALMSAHAIASISGRRTVHIRLALFMVGLLIAGLIVFSGLSWLHIAYMPYILLIAFLCETGTLALSALWVPLLEGGHLMGGGAMAEEMFLLGTVFVTGAVGWLAGNWKDRYESLLKPRFDIYGPRGRKGTEGIEEEADPELRGILKTIMFTIMPDSASLFLLEDGELRLRCSTGRKTEIRPSGLIHDAFARGGTAVDNFLRASGRGPGYLGAGRAASAAASAVKDGRFTFGVLAVDSAEEGAFMDANVKSLELFAGLVSGVIARQRIHAETNRSQSGLRVLQEESARLISSIERESIADIAAEGFHNTAQLPMVMFLKDGESFRLARHIGVPPPSEAVFTLKGTLADMAIKSAQSMYISNTRGYSMPVLPFGADRVCSTLIMPMRYDEETLGVVVFVSDETDPLRPQQLELLGVLCNQASVAIKNSMLHEEIKRQAVTDGLTGLFNHRHFQERLDMELKRSGRSARPFSLLLIDIDHFKKVNDTYGHPAGDEVLKNVAGIIRGALRGIDIPARYGGEEFAAVLLDSTSSDAHLTAERIRLKVKGMTVRAGGQEINVTVSIGLCSHPAEADNKADLVWRADKALYHAKASGRDRTVAWATLQDAQEETSRRANRL